MKRSLSIAVVCAVAFRGASRGRPMPEHRRNVIIFVADGLRHGSVNERDTPTFWAIRKQGVYFRNSYALFPTLTTANASAIATGHALGDTGDFSNTIWLGYALFDGGNFDMAPGTPVAFLENDRIIGDLDAHQSGNYLGEETLLSLARKDGYNTAAVGKVGPTAIQDASAIAPVNGNPPPPSAAIIIDDATGTAEGPALPPKLVAKLLGEDIAPEAPARTNGYALTSPYSNSYIGDSNNPGTLRANIVQQQWFTDVTTRGILPFFAGDQERPFALVYWSRDPDGTQHNQGDSLNALYPGINGPTSLAAIRNADHALRQIMDWLDAHPTVKENTDVVVTSDHGFATVARREIDRMGHPSAAESAQHYYFDANGTIDTEKGMLPNGLLAIDLAVGLGTSLWDPDRRGPENSRLPFRRIRLDSDAWEHPANGSGLLGPRIERADGSDAYAIVAANGGSDLIYVPSKNGERVREIVRLLLRLDYVGAVFVDDEYGPVGGALSLSSINLAGSTKLPRPSVVVAFKCFYLNDDDLQSAIQISDTSLQDGQGMHGGFGRNSTNNNMAAIGPDFKTNYTDDAPVSNADIVPVLAKIMGIALQPKGRLQGRMIREALRGQPDAPAVELRRLVSQPDGKITTVLQYQEFDGVRYLRSAAIETTK